MRVRLTETQVEQLAKLLRGTGFDPDYAASKIGIKGRLDDTSRQTLETLVFPCPECGMWKRLESIENGMCAPCAIATEQFSQ